MFYDPKPIHRVVSLILLPLSLLYATILLFKRNFSKKSTDFQIPIVSVGNLIVGGSGKTPFIIELCKEFENVCVISRGYGRKSKGLLCVSRYGSVETTVEKSGDEAMLIAQKTDASVIVCADRIQAISYALKELKPKVILLDDAFSKAHIKKYDILLYPKKIPNIFPLPSGPFREFGFQKKYADMVLIEGIDFQRIVKVSNPTPKMLLVTAIANPQRLEPFLPNNVVAKLYYPDHEYFDANVLRKAMQKHGATSILLTRKDAVKIDFDIATSVLELDLNINCDKLQTIKDYVDRYAKPKRRTSP
jgi:tetraacyldisaccharide 4'-kinase